MKATISIFILGLIFTSCELESVNLEPETKVGVHHSQTPVPTKIIGEFKALENRYESNTGAPLETGSLSITKDTITVRLSKHNYVLVLSSFSTISNLQHDCFYAITLEDGTVIKISYAFMDLTGEIWFMVDGVIYAILKNTGSTSPNHPEEPETPTNPIEIN